MLMKTKSIFIKSISLLLVFLMLFTALLSCAAGNELGGESSDVTDESSFSDKDNTVNNGNNSNDENNGNEDNTQTQDGSIVIVSDKEYTGQVIRADLPDDMDKTMYNDIRALFKKKVGKNPPSATDFVIEGEEKYDGPAILIGSTNYPETKTAKKALKEGQAKATIVGNKYVIVWTTEASAAELLLKLTETFNKNAKSDNVTITSKWNLTVTIEEVKFDESGLKTSIPLPDISSTGLSWNTNGRDSGHGSKIYIANNANSTHFTKYTAALKSAGFTSYATNKLHTNEFATFVTKEQIVHVMFFAPKNVIKVTVDPRNSDDPSTRFGLPGLKSENTAKKGTTEFVQLGMKQVSGSSENGMGYIVKLADGRFVVVDAGFAYSSGDGGNSGRFIVDTMKKMQGNNNKPVIAAFIITHIHTDHAGGFMGLANACANQVTIEKLIYNQPSSSQMNAVSNMSGRKGWIPDAIKKLTNAGSLKSVVKAHPGMQFFFSDLTITIMGSIDLIEDSSNTKMHNGNDSSVVTMFDINGVKFLLSGDCEPQEGKIIRDIYGGITNGNSVLKANFIQVAHHGYGNTNTDNNYQGGNDQNALNVMASGGVTSSGKSQIYAFVPVGLANGKDPAGYYDAVKNMDAMRIFAADHRIVAYNKNCTITVTSDGKYTMGTTTHDGFLIGTWSTY